MLFRSGLAGEVGEPVVVAVVQGGLDDRLRRGGRLRAGELNWPISAVGHRFFSAVRPVQPGQFLHPTDVATTLKPRIQPGPEGVDGCLGIDQALAKA